MTTAVSTQPASPSTGLTKKQRKILKSMARLPPELRHAAQVGFGDLAARLGVKPGLLIRIVIASRIGT